MLFPTEGELKQQFETAGAFYELESGGRRELCRSLLAIRRIGTQSEEAEALFVLTNPGKCLPTDQGAALPVDPPSLEEVPLQQADPDHSIYQLMRLMDRLRWNKTYVVNLTDLRAGNMDDLKLKLRFMAAQQDDRHSIFSSGREQELRKIAEGSSCIVAGWGTNAIIRDLAIRAFRKLNTFGPVDGLAHKTPPYYYHPFPHLHAGCLKWLDEMEVQLQKDAEPV
ncbi:DUF1643 domain-containing protein [Indiicoccus explosivorum]|uniref:DUF1643 domain-containing protein n=1 Tax=Indiicoccus explosivorum TaxID=1917864 RepID=UPI000B450C22|nr:DUF1643 domain-containing protein [Indiicoccus explosivorum]